MFTRLARTYWNFFAGPIQLENILRLMTFAGEIGAGYLAQQNKIPVIYNNYANLLHPEMTNIALESPPDLNPRTMVQHLTIQPTQHVIPYPTVGVSRVGSYYGLVADNFNLAQIGVALTGDTPHLIAPEVLAEIAKQGTDFYTAKYANYEGDIVFDSRTAWNPDKGYRLANFQQQDDDGFVLLKPSSKPRQAKNKPVPVNKIKNPRCRMRLNLT